MSAVLAPPPVQGANASSTPSSAPATSIPAPGMKQYKVQGPDGALHVIEGPEGASDDEVIAQAQKLFPSTSPATAAAASASAITPTPTVPLRPPPANSPMFGAMGAPYGQAQNLANIAAERAIRVKQAEEEAVGKRELAVAEVGKEKGLGVADINKDKGLGVAGINAQGGITKADIAASAGITKANIAAAPRTQASENTLKSNMLKLGKREIIGPDGAPTGEFETIPATELTPAQQAEIQKTLAQARQANALADIGGSTNPNMQYAKLYTKVQNGTATPDEITELAGLKQRLTLTGTNSFNLNNPAPSPGEAEYIANQVNQSLDPGIYRALTHGDKQLERAVTSELQKQDAQPHILTSATKQLGETAHELMPDFEQALSMLNNPTLAAKMGPIGSRWQEFLAGRVGVGDPDYDRLRTFVNLLQTGTARAHVGARGSSQIQSKFENLFNADRMDAATLKDTLTSTRDFLKGYENNVYPKAEPVGSTPSTPSAGNVNVQLGNGKVGTIPASSLQKFLSDNPGSKKLP